jgi:hypothetical protein
MIYLMTGNPGAGKSTVAVERAINTYAMAGRPVVANFPIDFAPICRDYRSKLSQASCRVIPDRPSRADLDAIGFGGTNEHDAGLIIVDEAGTWLNTRSWQLDKERDQVIDWLTQSRKRYWDLILVAQAASMLDKQVRDAVCEMVAVIRRMDRKKLMGFRLPRIHVAGVNYGLEMNAPQLETWWYRGIDAQQCFMSYRLFEDSPIKPTADETKKGQLGGHYCVLPATLTKFRDGKSPRTKGEAFRRAFRIEAAPPVKPPPKAKPPLMQTLAKLPDAERIKHWKRLNQLGAI